MMSDIELVSEETVVLYVDMNLYSDSVISKVVYGLSGEFFVSREIVVNKQKITLSKIKGTLDEDEFLRIRKQVSQDFADFKTREIIYQETKDLRTILFVKAFANRDDFVEFTFQEKC